MYLHDHASWPLPPEGARQGEFERAVRPHLERLRRHALRYAADGDEAQDWVQETLIKAYRAWERYESGTNLGAWLHTILRNTLISERRRRRVATVRFEEIDRVTTFGVSSGPTPGGDMALPLEGDVGRALDHLAPQFRETVVLSDVEGFSYREIARLTGVPVGTIRSRLHRARRALRRELQGHAGEAGLL